MAMPETEEPCYADPAARAFARWADCDAVGGGAIRDNAERGVRSSCEAIAWSHRLAKIAAAAFRAGWDAAMDHVNETDWRGDDG